ncbi:hypothetical protein PanWU01x14_318990, partial [Parasponia andersonii]
CNLLESLTELGIFHEQPNHMKPPSNSRTSKQLDCSDSHVVNTRRPEIMAQPQRLFKEFKVRSHIFDHLV